MRESGILMHITSLPGPWGIGTMGVNAYSFVDFLEQAGQRYWQILPLSPTGYGDSPYQAFSAFAGNHYLIDLDLLVAEGLLREGEIAAANWGSEAERVDFGAMYESRSRVLRIAFARFVPDEEYETFVRSNESWLADYGLFMALKSRLGGTDWQNWPDELKLRDPSALESVRAELDQEIRFQYFLQFIFTQQWKRLCTWPKQ